MDAVLVTSNPGKLRELSAIVEGTGLSVITLPLWLGEVENGRTYLENARLKASAALRMLGRAVLAEDAGLEVDAIAGLPGVMSARFAGPAATPSANNAKLLRLLDGIREPERIARFRAVAVLLTTEGREIIGEGTWEGSIAVEPRGDGGFGYDPLFIPAGETRTAAELAPVEKNVSSHRAQALRAVTVQVR